MKALKDVLMHVSHQHADRLLQLIDPENRVFIHEDDMTNAREWLRSGKKHLTPTQCEEAKAQIERIRTMTDDLGYQSLLAETAMGGEEWSQTNRYQLAIDSRYFSPKAFRRAEHARYANYYREGRSWSCFRIAQSAAFSEQTSLDAFKADLRVFFDLKDGEDLLVDVFPGCTDGVVDQWQVMIYREGLPKPYLKLNEQCDAITVDTYRPVHEYTLFYHVDTRRLDVISTLKTRRKELAVIFARTALGLDRQRYPVTPAPVNLNIFLDRPALDFRGIHRLESEIEEVIVESITLSSRAVQGGEFVISPNTGSTMDVYRFLSIHSFAGINSEQVSVRRATLSIRFGSSVDGIRPRETIRFSLTEPNKCSLDTSCVRAHYVYTVLLNRWGIFSDEATL